MLCPNCMSPYIQLFQMPADEPQPEEPLYECTECEYMGVATEFLPEDYR